MPDYRTMYDKPYVGSWDLAGRDVVVTIEKVVQEEITGKDGTKKRPVLYLRGKEKGVVLNVGNGNTIAAMYGTNTDGWVGKQITLYPTTTSMKGKDVDCIRIRPTVPKAMKEG